MKQIQDAEALLVCNADALRRLATRLLSDPNEVDDTLQEVWMRTMESPPPKREGAAAWLETVLRNVVRRRARQRRRLRSREARSARSERTESTVDVVERRQTLQALTDAVMSLDPATQELVFLRYFDDLPPREIARRQGVAVDVIYRGLERARARLRQRLANERTDWRAGLAALCGAVPLREATAAGFVVTGGGLLMVSKKVALIAIGGVLLAMLITLGPPWRAESAAAPPEPGSARPLSGAGVANVPTADTEAIGRTDLADDAVPPATDMAPYEFQLDVHAIGADDLPAGGTTIWLAPERHGLNSATTDPDGVLRLRWRGRTGTVTMVYASPGTVIGRDRLRRVTVRAGEKATVAIRVRAARKPGLTRLTVHRMRTTGGWLTLGGGESGGIGGVSPLEVSEDGLCSFRTRSNAHAAAHHEVTTSVEGRIVWAALSPKPRQRKVNGSGRLTGRVVDAEDKPVANALVIAGLRRNRRSSRTTRTDAKGRFELEGLPSRELFVRAGGGDHGLAHTKIAITGHGVQHWDAQLDRGIELRARLVDEFGQPLSKWRVELTGEPGEPWLDGTTTGDDGRFAIPNLEKRGFRLRVWAPKGVVPMWTATGIWPATSVVEVRVPATALATGSCVVQPRVPGHPTWARVRGRLWRDDLAEGVLFRDDGHQTPGRLPGVSIQHLPVGIMRLVATGPGQGFANVASVQVESDAELEYPADLDRPATLMLPEDFDVGKRKLQLLFLHEAVCSRAGTLSAKHRRISLPPGDYLIEDGTDSWRIKVVPGPNKLVPR